MKALLGCELRKPRKISRKNRNLLRKKPRKISRENRNLLRNKQRRISTENKILLENWKRAIDSYNSFEFDQKRGERGGFNESEAEELDVQISRENRVSDRISLLPDPIIHQIYSSLRCAKDVARTAILSKSWKLTLDSYNSFDFDQRWFRVAKERGGRRGFNESEAEKKNFREYVDRSLATRLDGVPCVEKFKLYVDNVDVELMIHIFHWIRAALVKDVKELDVQVCLKIELPLPVVLTELDSITYLKLSGNSLESLAAMKKPNLREILIKDANFLDVNMIKKLEENCPLLEDLRLVSCPQLTHLQISSLVKLKRVEVQNCKKVKSIEIASSNLETLWYHGTGYQECKIDLKGSKNVKNLTLRDMTMSDSAFENCILMCPLLENLVLQKCYSIKTLRIHKLALKTLTLIRCLKLVEVDIDAPKLHSFQYNGRVRPFSSINAPRLSEVKLSFDNFTINESYHKIENFSWNFDGSKGLKLIVYTKKCMKIFEEPRESDLFQEDLFKDLFKLELTASSSKVVKTVDDWLRNFHGKSLVLVSSNGELLKLVNTLVIDREDNPSCCELYLNKCWKHYIEDVEVSTLKRAEKTSFNFTWSSRKGKKRKREGFKEDIDK